MGCGNSKPKNIDSLPDSINTEIQKGMATQSSDRQGSPPMEAPNRENNTVQEGSEQDISDKGPDTVSVSNAIANLRLHASISLQAFIRRRRNMLALKDLGYSSLLYYFEDNSPEVIDGSMSPRSIEALHRCEVFTKVPPDVLPSVINTAHRRVYKPGERVVVAGAKSQSMFIVCSGQLACEVCGVQVRTMCGGESFGEVAVFAHRTWNLNKEHAEVLGNAEALESLLTRTADVICVEPSVLLEITVQDIEALLFNSCPRLVFNVWHIGTRQLRQAASEGSEQAQAAVATISDLHPLLAAGWLARIPGGAVRRILEAVPAEALPLLTLAPGDHAVRQGRLGDSAFLVASGLYSCVVDGVEVRQFAPWSAFGEVTLCARCQCALARQ